jgi:hypothetical protein
LLVCLFKLAVSIQQLLILLISLLQLLVQLVDLHHELLIFCHEFMGLVEVVGAELAFGFLPFLLQLLVFLLQRLHLLQLPFRLLILLPELP